MSDEEVRSLRESDAVVEAAPLARVDEEVRHLALQVDRTLYGVGYRDDEGWTLVAERPAEDPDDLAAVRDRLREWARGDPGVQDSEPTSDDV